jgi:hypothetical protein
MADVGICGSAAALETLQYTPLDQPIQCNVAVDWK